MGEESSQGAKECCLSLSLSPSPPSPARAGSTGQEKAEPEGDELLCFGARCCDNAHR